MSMKKMKWPKLEDRGKMKNFLYSVTLNTLKCIAIIISLYAFICSINLLSTSFRILGGKNISNLFISNDLLSNPVVGVMIGVLATALVQSSATSTSIIVSLASVGVEVRHTIPMIFGSNVGTSVTNTIVAIGQAGNRETFGRAFAAATVHDMFNWLTVIVMTGIETSTGVMEYISEKAINSMIPDTEEDVHVMEQKALPDFLKIVTKPLIESIIMLDRDVLVGWSVNDTTYANETTVLLHDKCACDSFSTSSSKNCPCVYLFSYVGKYMSDVWIGVILLAISLFTLTTCLLILMKILNSILATKMQSFIRSTSVKSGNEEPDFYNKWVSGYVSIVIGAVITVLVRSSSVFTSILTPLCGAGLVSLETIYPLTLGSNVGTTTTSLMAALSVDDLQYLKPSLQIALVHLLFNLLGILLFYPIPVMRIPLPLARFLGKTTAKYRWFAVLYLIAMFFVLPILVFCLSMLNISILYSIVAISFTLLLTIVVISFMQKNYQRHLPACMQTWKFLPLCMRSLQPLDNLISRALKVIEGRDKAKHHSTGNSIEKEEEQEREENVIHLNDIKELT